MGSGVIKNTLCSFSIKLAASPPLKMELNRGKNMLVPYSKNN